MTPSVQVLYKSRTSAVLVLTYILQTSIRFYFLLQVPVLRQSRNMQVRRIEDTKLHTCDLCDEGPFPECYPNV